MVYVPILATLQQILKSDAVLAEVYVHCIVYVLFYMLVCPIGVY